MLFWFEVETVSSLISTLPLEAATEDSLEAAIASTSAELGFSGYETGAEALRSGSGSHSQHEYTFVAVFKYSNVVILQFHRRSI